MQTDDTAIVIMRFNKIEIAYKLRDLFKVASGWMDDDKQFLNLNKTRWMSSATPHRIFRATTLHTTC